MNSYQEIIAKSRYARFLPELQRRENWDETVDRWIGFMSEHMSPKLSKDHRIWTTLRDKIYNLEVLPSMRSIMTAGEALNRTNVAAYNCAYLPIDHPRAFDEAMYILLCGTGVGFSCEAKYVDKLAYVPTLEPITEVLVVEDSKEGWCHAFKDLIRHLYSGDIPTWDVSKVRPKGAPLKTFGGRASGPEPLVSLFKYTVEKFRVAQGRQLTPIECHDIMCKIGEVVVVGGVRRSAMISLGDLGDYDHATAKSGDWRTLHGERELSNNSAVYEKKPSIGTFMKEWLGIHNSYSGERGIFNREASQKQASKWLRRDPNIDYGTNPCSEIILRPKQFCNLSTIVVTKDDNFKTISDKIELATIIGTFQSTLTKFPYLRQIWTKNTEAERLLGVSMTGIFSNFLSNQQLDRLREHARDINLEWAVKLDITPSAAITCVKPEGTVTQLAGAEASGLHPGHAPFYIRRVRQDKGDPLTQFLISQGVANEPCVMKPDSNVVFSFPQRCYGVTRKEVTALDHLEIWLNYQRHYCEHKPSVTISVKDHEWMEVGAWVYKHFDECTGVSFLPDDGGSYQQAPYEEITEDEYYKMSMPVIDWSMFIEDRDNVEGVQSLACVAGVCAI